METEKLFSVYKHTCPNHKIYIGITSNKINRRWQNGFGYRENKHFFNAILKYGWDNIKHEILLTNLTKEEACKKEIELIAFYKSNQSKYGYNSSTGGERPTTGRKLSDETKEKLRQAQLGRKHTQETIERMKTIHTGKYHTEETKQKLSEARKGKKNTMYGKNISSEHKKRISKANSKPVICIETGVIYSSITEAERKTNISDSSIQYVCKHKRKTAGGYKWEYWKGEINV